LALDFRRASADDSRMNKAFVREPDADEYLCPRCGAVGDTVPESAVSHFVSAEIRKQLADTAYFCATASCPVAYFDAMEGTVTADQLRQPIHPKDPSAPLCGCFGLSLDDVDADIAEGTPRRIRQLLEKSKSAEARCAEAAPSGRCCLPEVQRLYFKRKSRADA
jgi:hypothetical protein